MPYYPGPPPDPATLELIRSLTPYVRPLRDNNLDQYPEAFCDSTTAQIYRYVLGTSPMCGSVEARRESPKGNHIWIKYKGINIDFTAHQFPTLLPFVTQVNGFPVLYGTDEQLTSYGYKILDDTVCFGHVLDAQQELVEGVWGNCECSPA